MKTLRWLNALNWAVVRTLGRRLLGRRKRPSWSLRTEIIQQTMHATLVASLRNGVEWFRTMQSRGAQKVFFADVVTFEEGQVGGVPGLWCMPQNQTIERAVLYLHGGGYVFGDPSTYRDLCARIAVGASARVFCPHYRRAPEHPCPAAQDDALAAFRGMLEQSPGGELCLMGDSAGAGLVMATLLSQRDADGALPGGAVLMCPWVDPHGGGASMEAHQETDIGPASWIRWCAELAVPPELAEDPRLRPTSGELGGLPPVLLQVGGAEMLHDQGIALAQALRAAEVDTELHVEPDMFHVWQLLASQIEAGEKALEQICRFARAHT